jgi:hypothetical protein
MEGPYHIWVQYFCISFFLHWSQVLIHITVTKLIAIKTWNTVTYAPAHARFRGKDCSLYWQVQIPIAMTFFLKGILTLDAARSKESEHQNLNSMSPTKVQRKSDKLVFWESTWTLLIAEIWRKYMKFHDKWVPVTMAGYVLRLQMEKQPLIWKAAAEYWITCHWQLTRGGPPTWGLGEMLTTPHGTNWPYYKTDTCVLGLDWSFGMT